MTDDQQLSMGSPSPQDLTTVGDYQFEPIKGYPMLHWKGKRPFTSTQFYPAQLREVHGEAVEDWRNKIYWGDNLQVMSHLLKEFRGKVDLVYIDPPFDSKADYKKKVQLKGKDIKNDYGGFEEKQYTDIWTNDEYLQFMYERLILIRELISRGGTIFVHCDWRKSHHLRTILDEIFGADNFLSDIVWKRRGGKTSPDASVFESITDSIFWYAKSSNYIYNPQYSKADSDNYIKTKFVYKDEGGRLYRLSPLNAPYPRPTLQYEYKGYKPHPNGWSVSFETMERYDHLGKLYFPENKNQRIQRKQYLDEWEGRAVQSLWTDIAVINSQAEERLDYPTQKPEVLLERIIKAASKPGDVVFDCFMGSGTTQAVSMKLGRRFIGADINLGSVQITTKRMLGIAQELEEKASQTKIKINSENEEELITQYTGFEVHNVNSYDVFRNPIQAKDLLLEALEINPLEKGSLFDGEKDGRLWKIMPINRITTRADLNELIAGFDYKAFQKRHQEHPHKAVEKITLVCMGHDPDLASVLKQEVKPFVLDVEVVDILRDKQEIQFKRDSEAQVSIEGNELIIETFYPMNLLAKLSLQQENVEDWRELVESVMIDWNYDGAILEPKQIDIPDKNELVKGRYSIPDDAGTIRIKITDLLSESLEMEVQHG